MAKRSTASSNQVVSAFTSWISSIIKPLRAPEPAYTSGAWRDGKLAIKIGTTTVAVPLSAPNTVVATLWADHAPTLILARDQPAGQWNAVVTLLQCDGVPHDRYLELVAAVAASGQRDQAQLAWMQARTIQDPEDRKDGLFAQIFPKAPRAAAIDEARSAAAMMERLLPYARSKSAVDRLIVADSLRDYAAEGLTDVSGPRRTRYIEGVDRAITILTGDAELCIVDAVKHARIAWARALAFGS